MYFTLHIHILSYYKKFIYMCICIHMCVCTYMYAYMSEPEKSLEFPFDSNIKVIFLHLHHPSQQPPLVGIF